MNVLLKIENDKELRDYVKELISGQVKSIVRQDIKDVLNDVLQNKIKNINNYNIDSLIKEEITRMVRKEILSNVFGKPSFIQAEAKKIINEYIRSALRDGLIE